MRSLVEDSAGDLGDAGWDQYYGYGRVNAYQAVTALTPTPTPVHVGGIIVPVSKVELLTPWLGLAALVGLAALTVVLVRRRGD